VVQDDRRILGLIVLLNVRAGEDAGEIQPGTFISDVEAFVAPTAMKAIEDADFRFANAQAFPIALGGRSERLRRRC
jgi:hypothetical protein